MTGLGRLLASATLIGLLLSACNGVVEGTASCSCAAGTTHDGTFYQQYANTSVRAGDPIGESDRASGCCGEKELGVTIYSIKGIDPRLAIATRSSDGRTYFNVASGLSSNSSKPRHASQRNITTPTDDFIWALGV